MRVEQGVGTVVDLTLDLEMFDFFVKSESKEQMKATKGMVQMCVDVCKEMCVCVCCHVARLHSSLPAGVLLCMCWNVAEPPPDHHHLYPQPTATPPAPRVPVTQPRLRAICISAPASAKALN